MTKGEKAILRCRSDYAYGDKATGSIPADATLNFEVELIGFGPKKKEHWEYSTEEKLEEGMKLKESGTELFKAGKFLEAIGVYDQVGELLEHVNEGLAIWLSSELNSAQAYINIGDYSTACVKCTTVLKKDPRNLKALYRRGLARNHIGLAEEALVDLDLALSIDPDNKPVKSEIVKAKKIIVEADKKAKKTYGNMFKKISVYDDKVIPYVPLANNPNNPKVRYRIFVIPFSISYFI